MAAKIAEQSRDPRQPAEAALTCCATSCWRSRRSSARRAAPTIEDVEFEADIEALIQREDMVVTVTHGGYIKRVPLSTYRAQRRGGTRPRRHGDARRGFRLPGVRRRTPYADAVLLDPRHGLQAQGLPPAARQPAGARQGDGQPAAAGGGRDDLHRHAAAGGREQLGQSQRHVRDRRAATCGATRSAISST